MMPSLVRFALHKFSLLFFLIDLRSLPVKAKLETEFKDFKLVSTNLAKNDFKEFAQTKLNSVSNAVSHNDNTKAYATFRHF